MAICQLSEREASNLEIHGIAPSCLHHCHIPFRKAEQAVADQGGRWIGSNPKKFVRFSPRVWRPVNSVLQLVEGVIQGRKGHFSCPAGARGARGRNTSVYATNLDPRSLNLLHGTT